MERLKSKGIEVVIYRRLRHVEFGGLEVIGDLDRFKALSDIIVANRKSECLSDVREVFSRDMFGDS